MKCQNKAEYEVIWGPKDGESKFSCRTHVSHLINPRATVNTVVMVENDCDKTCQYEIQMPAGATLSGFKVVKHDVLPERTMMVSSDIYEKLRESGNLII